MGDNFTDPDTAGTDERSTDFERPPKLGGDPDADGSDPSEGVVVIGDAVSCERCVHARTCKYRDGWKSMLFEQENPETLPFDPDQLAAICDYYQPETAGGGES